MSLVLPSFVDDRDRSYWVQMMLRRAGTSFAEIARRHGWNRTTVSKAMFIASYPQELAVAEALGLDPKVLFPERYRRDGSRLHHVIENATRMAPRPVKKEIAA
jgi:lambda repressor-like predicted transcriptional regulator